MTIEATEKRYFGLKRNTRAVSPGGFFLDPLVIIVVSPDEIVLTIAVGLDFPVFLPPRRLFKEQINEFFKSDIPGNSIGSRVRLSWKP
ncbi:MAG: hypothetical protein A2798_01180 [Candidatus Levybacteria bacterium RIFCSPHIGHO2_01_FULL_37_17]|nr:MAG: hypothetical protein A2798_01180 [Candidatus Levybacteria bacterium RIFCSPHIGHO2_01_FULL_37_17]OGH37065.1 MAG: hypothetical protein A2959_02040 [Candidatus Levybacteria bacterium RIFCSPLOWO2_01_FULL_38_23]